MFLLHMLERRAESLVESFYPKSADDKVTKLLPRVQIMTRWYIRKIANANQMGEITLP